MNKEIKILIGVLLVLAIAVIGFFAFQNTSKEPQTIVQKQKTLDIYSSDPQELRFNASAYLQSKNIKASILAGPSVDGDPFSDSLEEIIGLSPNVNNTQEEFDEYYYNFIYTIDSYPDLQSIQNPPLSDVLDE